MLDDTQLRKFIDTLQILALLHPRSLVELDRIAREMLRETTANGGEAMIDEDDL